MTEKNLTDLLAGAAERVPVSPVPLDSIVSGAQRARRGRVRLAVIGSSVVVAAAVAGLALVAGRPASKPSPPPVGTSADTRLVGVGHVAVEVPLSWKNDATHCGTPIADTVLINSGPIPACSGQRPRGVESIRPYAGKPDGPTPDQDVTIDGVRGQRTSTTCTEPVEQGDLQVVPAVCTATLYFPSLDVTVRADSSTDAAAVDRSLERVRVFPDLVGVPDTTTVFNDKQEKSGAAYVELLKNAGLAVQVRMRKGDDLPAGFVVATEPVAGTMLELGAPVTVVVSDR